MAEEFARLIDRYTAEYVRVFSHPIERVWRAISDPKEVSVWFWRARFDLRVGGAYAFGPDDGDMKGIFTAIEPPRLLRLAGPTIDSNPEGYMQFELEPVDGGVRMRFVQHFTPGFVPHPEWGADPPDVPPPWRAGTLAGWHAALEDLADVLDGVRAGTRWPATEFGQIVEAWTKTESAAGLTPQQAAVIARELRGRERWIGLTRTYREHMRATMPRTC